MKVSALLSVLLVGCGLTLAQEPARTSPPPPAPEAVEEFQIGPNDKLDIRVYNLAELNREVRVANDGTISLFLLGQVPVAGLTPRQAEEVIARLLRERKMVNDPQVAVFVEEFVSRRVSVQGAVSKPGPVDLLGDRTLLDVIGQAGGLGDRAGATIFVIRQGAREEERIEIDAERLVYKGDPLINIAVKPGDIIMVPYAQDFRVFVNGAVKNPGKVEYKSGEEMTVLQAVTAAGGVSDRANEGKVRVIRRNPDGSKKVFTVNLKRIKRGKDEDLVLERNDIVVVPESFF